MCDSDDSIRRRALRHALRYRARAVEYAHVIDSLLLGAELDRARIAGLNLAADQYSESRDHWMLRARALEAAIRRALRVAAAGCNDWRAGLEEVLRG